jgi:hypothetical protein
MLCYAMLCYAMLCYALLPTTRFKQQNDPINYVPSVAEGMHTYPPQHTLSGGNIGTHSWKSVVILFVRSFIYTFI